MTFAPRRNPRRRRPGTPRGAAAEPVYAALDLGTNNCRLLVARPTGDGFEVIDSFSRIVRLGEGLLRSRRLSDAAVERTIAALKICAAKIVRAQATRLRCVATEACRMAENCDGFVDFAQSETGVRLEIIDSVEEARLAVAGAAPLLHRDTRYAVVFDIGGGSTEVMWLEVPRRGAPRTIGCLSVPWGVVKMAETFGGEEVAPAAYAAMIEAVHDHLEAFERQHRIRTRIGAGEVQMLGTSGTVTTVTGIRLGLPRYRRDQVDGRYLGFDEIACVSESLRAMDYRTRTAEPCVGRERADLVVPGCAILAAICRMWPIGRLRVADRGVREGILFSLIAADRAPGRAIAREARLSPERWPGA